MSKSNGLFIPPLPSAKVLSSGESGKENDRGGTIANVTSNVSRRLRLADRPSRLALTTKHDSLNSNEVTEEADKSSFSTCASITSMRDQSVKTKRTPLRSAGRSSTCRVVRYGETIDSLFCLQEDSCEGHNDLCNEIANGNKADDPRSWRKVLEMASRYASLSSSLSKIEGRDLIRLHRRATTRFPIRFGSVGASSKRDEAKDVVGIWLLYAEIQAKFDSRSEAQQTYQRILTLSKGQEVDDATVYMAMANFECANEGDRERAIELIKMGIERGAEPLIELKVRLRELGHSCIDSATQHSILSSAPSLPVSSSRHIVLRHQNDGRLTQKPPQADVNMDQKRMRKNVRSDDSLDSSDDDDTGVVTFNRRKKIEAETTGDNEDTVALGIISETSREDTESHADETITIPTDIKAPVRSRIAQQKARKVTSSEGSLALPQSKFVLRDPQTPAGVPSKSINSLSSGKALLSRKRLGGSAMRVNAMEAEASRSDEEEGDTIEINSGKSYDVKKKQRTGVDERDGLVQSKRDAVKKRITKTDLTYMLNWNPLASRKSKTNVSDEHDDSNANVGTPSPNSISNDMQISNTGEAITNETKHSFSASSKMKNNNKSPGNTASSNTGRSSQENESPREQKHEYETPGSGTSSIPIKLQSLSPSEMAMVAKSNMDFLPLVNEDNILRVNSVPYAKLGVIGKGGSCKVYRALSKECSVLAIKKVKLAGMDKKGISGYANEIKLLKRLRGNPAIIQMFDSEVDLKRKAIFLVMEVGEVDLNHVLQQQALMDGEQTGGTSRRNINFIRLTWQQMLSAVQCIHEERIIHGDLKPANFLFVRGTLKLIDFGIAKAIQSDDTTNIYRDSQIGTLNYMSPEAILDSGSGEDGARMRCGKPSDVWALGCILYQMCYGRTPFAELHIIQKLQAIVNPNHKIKYPDTIDEAAIDAIQLCLRRTPESRAPIIGKNGLLNEHVFLHSKKKGR